MGDLVTQDMKKAEVLHGFLALVFSSDCSKPMAQAVEGKACHAVVEAQREPCGFLNGGLVPSASIFISQFYLLLKKFYFSLVYCCFESQ